MINRIVICDRCGKVVDKPHPDRITIAKHHVETWKNYWGEERQKSVYKTEKSMHLCSKCEIKFNEFWENKE